MPLLEVWRGEWSEFYASWARKNTLTFDVADYYITGSWWADTIATIVFSGLTFLLAFMIRSRRLTSNGIGR
ncbi:hypothetical protein A9Q81_12640 [Gammaproteobacteria bacterium 42_54_T18]|nr:hypothetical protein A9Q81_12640 [Gammaproteobacteria bacterium 42_54_T18]